MKRQCAAALIALGLSALDSLGGTALDVPPEIAKGASEKEWEASISAFAYFAKNARDYVNPNLTADRDWLHLEARYNYEAIKTGSIWVGRNFSFGKEVEFVVTPMVGGVMGDITGIAPGYTVSVSYKALELFSQGEYFVDAGTHNGHFFYNASEVTCSVSRWFRFGYALDRTKALGSNFDVRRGPLIGFRYKKVDFTTYWLNPGKTNAVFVIGTTLNF